MNANMLDDCYRTQHSTCYIVRTQSDSTTPKASSMQPKQRTIMHNSPTLENMFELMFGIPLNNRLATSLVLTVT